MIQSRAEPHQQVDEPAFVLERIRAAARDRRVSRVQPETVAVAIQSDDRHTSPAQRPGDCETSNVTVKYERRRHLSAAGPIATTQPFIVGNSEPELKEVAPGAFIQLIGNGGNVIVRYKIADATRDICRVAPFFEARRADGFVEIAGGIAPTEKPMNWLELADPKDQEAKP